MLTRSPTELVYWELPACQAKYRIASFGEVIALSPLRQHVVGLIADRGFRVYETATGRCLGRLEQPTCDQMSFPRCWFRPDGKQLLVLFWDLEHALVVVYDLTTGKIASAFGIPQVSPVELHWIDPRYVFLQTYPRDRGKRYLLDLENRALVAQYGAEVVDSTAGRQAQLSDGRLLSSRSVELRWRSFEGSGTKVWEQIRPLAWSAISVTNSESEAKQVTREVLREQARKAVSGLSIPRYLFPKIDNVKLPDGTL